MSDGSIHIDLNDSIFEEIRKLRADFGKISGTVAEMEKKTNTSLGSIGKQLKAINLVSVYQGFQNVSQELTNLSKPGLEFNASLTELSAMSGIAGKELETLGNMARENAKTFGGDAAKSVETYKTLLAQLGPQLAKHPDLFNKMSQNAEILAKSMGGDVVGAAGVLSTAMHQYEVDLNDVEGAQGKMVSMMNALAASANAGSSELPQLQQAVGVAGGSAKRAGVEFESMLSAIQVLDTASYKGSEGGTALRAVMDKLAKGRFLPENVKEELAAAGIDINNLSDKTISFTDKMRLLQPIAEDAALVGLLFGEPYAGAAQALIKTADAQDKQTKAIKGTTEAQDYAAKMMESTTEKLARQKAKIDDIKVSFFEATGGATAYLGPITEIGQTMVGLSPIFSTVKSGLGLLKKLFDSSKVPTEGFVGGIDGIGKSSIKSLGPAKGFAGGIDVIGKSSIKSLGPAKGFAAGIDGIGKTSGRSKGLMSGLGSAMTSIGWAAIAAGAVAVASAIYDVASGANEARLNMEAFQKGSAKGQKIGEKITSGVTSKRDAEIEKARNLQLSGEIDEKEFKRREIEARKNAKTQIREEISVKNIDKSFRDRDVKKHQNRQKEDDQKFFSTEEDRQLFGMKSIASDLADAKGDRARVNKSLTVLNSAFSENDQELARAEAELKGMDNKKAEPKSNPIKPSGYSSTDKEKDYQGTGGEMKNINIHIDNLVKDLTISTTNLTQSSGQVKQIITEALVAAVRNTEVAL